MFRFDSVPAAIDKGRKEAQERSTHFVPLASACFGRAMLILILFLLVATVIALCVGYRTLDLTALSQDEMMRSLFFRLRLPRVLLAAVVGAALATVGASLQALFRNPLADPFTLGVSGGGTLGASLAIALGWGISIWGVPVVFLAAFAGAGLAVSLVYQMSRTGAVVLPGTLLLAGVVMNLVAGAGVIIIQYLADYMRALQILRWSIGSLDVVGFDLIWR
ncbi:MAG: hypothetical protein EXQ58_11730, partial [Acidobacteria bacterium]|nr:hypothetical protein [Acidobacteriota bacterium]